ncbi:MAG: hypothetical protein HRU28_09470 [Rhizobiales bacterium]|nr:hypothetical protein [Hyphomicrobiales bacterium]
MAVNNNSINLQYRLGKLFGLVLGAFFLMQVASGQAAETLDQNNKAYFSQLRIYNADLAEENWTLNCRGCHKLGAVGLGKEMPNMNGQVAKFLAVEGGVEYLSRVPGIANSPLNNEELADLMNWMLLKYDAAHIPKDFTGFTAEKIESLRKNPLNMQAKVVRAKLIAEILMAEKVNEAQE